MGLVRNCPTFDVLHCGGTVFSVELCNVDRQELPGPFLEQGQGQIMGMSSASLVLMSLDVPHIILLHMQVLLLLYYYLQDLYNASSFCNALHITKGHYCI